MQFVKARCIPFAPRGGFENMAADEYLISWHRRTGVPVMRMYAWSPPAISLGRYQPIDSINLEACCAGGVDVVRRITGGGAIFHDREVTYSLVCAGDDLGDTPRNVPESFEIMNRFLIVFYRWLGFHAVYAKDTSLKNISGRRAAFCFSSNEKYDIMIGNNKIGGNAQRRMRNVVLQHGSIPLSIDRERTAGYFTTGLNGANFTALNELVSFDVEPESMARLLVESFSETTGMKMYSEDFSPDELAEIDALMKRKYLQPQWNLEGREDDGTAASTGMA
jgi:lipoyl(octanoyl) transferase